MSKIYGADKQTWKRVGAATKYVERIAKPPPNGRERTKLSQSTRNLFVLITGESAVSGYEGYEVRWDGSNWKKVGGGFTWGDSAMFRPILEINGDGLDIPDSSGSIDGVYQVLRLIGTDNKAYWFVNKGGGDVVLAKITGAPTGGEYPCDFYANGKDAASTGSGTIEVLNLAVSETLPTNTWVVAHAVAVTSTGGA
jgi:hypothetical protein